MERPEIATAAITTIGAIITALITTAGTLLLAWNKHSRTSTPKEQTRKRRRLGLALAFYALAAMLAIAMGVGIWVLMDEGTARRLSRALPQLEDYKKQTYAAAGFGFVYPKKWELEDYALKFGGGGEVVLVRDRDGEWETQSMRFVLVNIPEHHWKDPRSEFVHFRERLKSECNEGFAEDVAPFGNGLQVPRFTCKRKTQIAGKTYLIDRTEYWHQITKCVRLSVRVRSEVPGGPARTAFDQEQARVLESIRFDDVTILRNKTRAHC